MKMPYNYYLNQYMPTGYNPYYSNQLQRPQETYQPVQYQRPTSLFGKVVDSIDVAKVTDVQLDGSIAYYPLADGSAIVTKQLQQDGTSKLIVYKPISNDEKQEDIKYITENDFKARLGDFNMKDIKDIKEELKSLKKQFKSFLNDIEEKEDD